LSDQMKRQELLLDGVAQPATALTHLVESLSSSTAVAQAEKPRPEPGPVSPEEIEASVHAVETARSLVAAALPLPLGYEIDQCSGQLTVLSKSHGWITIPRGQWRWVNVYPDGDGYWYWRCGDSFEKSRGESDFRQRVNWLRVFHSPNNRQITWYCY